jgi:hypothetical protein
MSVDSDHVEDSRLILGTVRDWPLHERLDLVARILHVATEEVRPRRAGVSAEELQAMLGTDKGTTEVSDEDIERWLHERRMARAR